MFEKLQTYFIKQGGLSMVHDNRAGYERGEHGREGRRGGKNRKKGKENYLVTFLMKPAARFPRHSP